MTKCQSWLNFKFYFLILNFLKIKFKKLILGSFAVFLNNSSFSEYSHS